MTVQTDHDQTQITSRKIDHMADLVRIAARKGLEDGTLTPEMLQSVNEEGGLFQDLAITELTRIMKQVAMIDSDLFEPLPLVSASAVQSFKAKDKFKENKTVDGVKIYDLGANFKKHFVNLNGTGKNELNVPATKLRVHKLRKNSVDTPIIAELGGETVVETYLATMFELMKKQGMGQSDGPLLVDGKANIFYIKDDNGALWAVVCGWYAGRGWSVGAYAISYPYGWAAGFQVFSR